MKMRQLGRQLEVSAVGVGCMGMSFAYGGQEEEASLATLRRALDIGVNFFDTAEVYGPYENEVLVGKALKGRRDGVIVATKFGFKISEHGEGAARMIGLDSRPEHVKAVAEASLKRLGVETIDLLYQHRVDPSVPIEDTVGAMADLVKEGKVRALGLSEASAKTIRRAHAVHPIAAIQSEYSLWSREPEVEIFPLCRELGIGFVPYSPLGRGLLTGAIRSRNDLGADDWRLSQPRFQDDAMAANQQLIETLQRIAKAKSIAAAQLALAWVLHQGDFIVPIPGARKIRHLEENSAAAEISLSAKDLAEIEAASPVTAVAGARYTDAALQLVNR